MYRIKTALLSFPIGLFLLAAVPSQNALADSVTLYRITHNGSGIKVTYRKDFETCVHLLSESGNIVHIQNHYCTSGVPTTSTQKPSDFTVSLNIGERFKLCHGNNYNVCSSLVAVTFEPPTVADVPAAIPPAPQPPVFEPTPDYFESYSIPFSPSYIAAIRAAIRVQIMQSQNRQREQYQRENEILWGAASQQVRLLRELQTQELQAQQWNYRSTASESCPDISQANYGQLSCYDLRSSWFQSLGFLAAQSCYQTCLNQL